MTGVLLVAAIVLGALSASLLFGLAVGGVLAAFNDEDDRQAVLMEGALRSERDLRAGHLVREIRAQHGCRR